VLGGLVGAAAQLAAVLHSGRNLVPGYSWRYELVLVRTESLIQAY
jgi:hypothetical protein